PALSMSLRTPDLARCSTRSAAATASAQRASSSSRPACGWGTALALDMGLILPRSGPPGSGAPTHAALAIVLRRTIAPLPARATLSQQSGPACPPRPRAALPATAWLGERRDRTATPPGGAAADLIPEVRSLARR